MSIARDPQANITPAPYPDIDPSIQPDITEYLRKYQIQAEYLLSLGRQQQGQYAFNGIDAKVYQSRYTFQGTFNREIVRKIKEVGVLLDHMTHLQVMPNVAQQPVYSQFKQNATMFVQLPGFITGKIGFNILTANTFGTLTDDFQVQERVKREDKTIYKVNSLMIEFENKWIVQHKSYAILSQVRVFSQDFTQQADQLLGQEVYELVAEKLYYYDDVVKSSELL